MDRAQVDDIDTARRKHHQSDTEEECGKLNTSASDLCDPYCCMIHQAHSDHLSGHLQIMMLLCIYSKKCVRSIQENEKKGLIVYLALNN